MTVWLCTDDAWNVNGKIFHVAGGVVALSRGDAVPADPARGEMDGGGAGDAGAELADGGDPEPGTASGRP